MATPGGLRPSQVTPLHVAVWNMGIPEAQWRANGQRHWAHLSGQLKLIASDNEIDALFLQEMFLEQGDGATLLGDAAKEYEVPHPAMTQATPESYVQSCPQHGAGHPREW